MLQLSSFPRVTSDRAASAPLSSSVPFEHLFPFWLPLSISRTFSQFLKWIFSLSVLGYMGQSAWSPLFRSQEGRPWSHTALGSKPAPCPVDCPWKSDWTPLSLSFPMCEMGVIIAPSLLVLLRGLSSTACAELQISSRDENSKPSRARNH